MDDDETYFAHLNNAVTYLRRNDLESALDACTMAAAIHADGPEALCILGLVVFQMGDAGRAISLLERAHAQDPDCSDYADALAVMYGKLGKIADGLYYGKLAVALKPHPRLSEMIPAEFRDYGKALETAAPSPHYVNAFVGYQSRRFDQAVELCRRELRINGRHAPCYHLLGRSLAALGHYDQAVDALHAAIHLDRTNVAALADLGDSLLHLGRLDEAGACHRRAVAMAPGDADIHARALAAAACFPETDGAAMIAGGRALRDAALAGAEPVNRADFAPEAPRTKIRIGYLSNEFYGAPDVHFIDAVLKSHNRARFEIFGYQQNAHSDLSTTRLRSHADQWREIYDVDDDTAAMIIAGDGVDILVDLCRHGDGQRLGLLARRPAPVQVSWLSWPNGAGAGVFDFVLGDAVTGPADRAALDGETWLEIAAGLMAFDAESVTMDASRLAQSPAAGTDMVTFGAVGDMARITPAVAETWAAVLDAVPASRLLLGNVTTQCAGARARAQDLFSHFGVVDRIAFQEAVDEDVVNLEFLSQVDVLLDAFPVSGTTELCEALVMGIPVVTLAAAGRPSRTGASILHAAGRGDWAADDAGAYVEIAAGLAADRNRLAEMRAVLGAAVAASSLCDRAGFTAALEDAYQRALASRPAKASAPAKTKKPAATASAAKKKAPAKKKAAAKPKARRRPAGRA